MLILSFAVQRSQTRQRLVQSPARWNLRCFHSSEGLRSGHSRWSTIKHDKGKADAVKNKQRSVFAVEIATASRLFGPDPASNPRLADLITKAKKSSFAKSSIEAAIARGQGRSASGESLEAVTVEGILPQNVAMIIDCETDNKSRTLMNVRLVMKEQGGSLTPTTYLFTKKGKIVFQKHEDVGVDAVFEQALEVGALDVTEDADQQAVVFTEPTETKFVGESMSKTLGLNIVESEIIWDANEDTKVPVETPELAADLIRFVETLQEREPSVRGVYLNVAPGSMDEESWADFQGRLSA